MFQIYLLKIGIWIKQRAFKNLVIKIQKEVLCHQIDYYN
jgi:hypothetical protein